MVQGIESAEDENWSQENYFKEQKKERFCDFIKRFLKDFYLTFGLMLTKVLHLATFIT